MSAFVKNYYSPKDPDLFLSVTWETGYRNIQVYHNQRLVHTIAQPAALIKGVTIQDEELGTIKFRFTTERPRKLEVKVNNKKFKTINKRDLGYDYTGLITIFTTLCVLAAMESIIIGGSAGFDFSYPFILVSFTLGILISVAYGVTSYLLSKRVSWSYFMGTGIFTVTSLLAVLNVVFGESGFGDLVFLIIRFGMLIYIYLQMKHILKEMKKTIGSNEDNGLLDS